MHQTLRRHSIKHMNLCLNPIPSRNGEQTWIPWLILQLRKEESKLCQCPLAVDARLRGPPNAQCSPLPRKPGMECMKLQLQFSLWLLVEELHNLAEYNLSCVVCLNCIVDIPATTVNELNQEWRAIYKSKAMGKLFLFWLRDFPEILLPAFPIPTAEWLHDVSQLCSI